MAVVCRFTVVVSNAERNGKNVDPYDFRDIKSDVTSYGKGETFIVPTVRKRLICGDYAVEGHVNACCVERKTVPDFLQCTIARHAWFRGCLERMSNKISISAVIVEATLAECIQRSRKKNLAKPISRSVLSWSMDFPNVHWIFANGRRDAEVLTFRWLEMFYRKYVQEY